MIDLKGIYSIVGQPSLFKLITATKNGCIFEHLVTNAKTSVNNVNTKYSALEEIAIYTKDDQKQIAEIMKIIFDKENGGKCPDAKVDDKTALAYFETIFPEYDKSRVYLNNIRKLFSWYNLLQETNNLKVKEVTADAASEEQTKLHTTKEQHNNFNAAQNNNVKMKTSTGIKRTAGVRKTGVA